MDDYAILGLEPGATLEQIKHARNASVKAWHPDRFIGQPAMQAVAEQRMKLINAAYDRLLTRAQPSGPRTPPPYPGERARRDQQRREQAQRERARRERERHNQKVHAKQQRRAEEWSQRQMAASTTRKGPEPAELSRARRLGRWALKLILRRIGPWVRKVR